MPFQSKRQMRAAFAGKIPGIDPHEWAHATPDIKDLPDRAPPDIKDLPDRAPNEKGKPTLRTKESNGDMIQYFMDNPDKLKAKKERDRRELASKLERKGLGGQEADDIAAKKISNFKLDGERMFNGLDCAIENAKGSKRYWHDPHGKEKGSTLMHYAYGYVRGSKGTDGDHVDVYLGPNEKAENVYLVDQMKKPDFKEFDEQKCMLGFDSEEDAKKAYLKQYNDPKFFGGIKTMKFEEFKMKVLDKENHGSKLAVSAGWIRERAVNGLARRNIALDRPEQAQIARKAVNYARAKETDIANAGGARDQLQGVLGDFKKKAPNVARPRQSPGASASAAQDLGVTPEAYAHLRQTMGIAQKVPIEAAAIPAFATGLQRHVEQTQLKGDLQKAEKGKTVKERPESPVWRGADAVTQPLATGYPLGLLGGIGGALVDSVRHNRSPKSKFSPAFTAAGALGGGLLGGAIGVHGHNKREHEIEGLRGQIADAQQKAAALSPVALSHLGHAGLGAGIGAVAGGLGGLAHADPGQRQQGALRGALVGAGIGAAGGAGISALKQQGAHQLSTLQGQAREAESAAVGAHAHARGLEQNWNSPAPAAAPAPRAAAPARAVDPNATGAVQVQPHPLAAKADPNATGAVQVRPLTIAQKSHVDPLANTQAQAIMTPEAHGFRRTESPYATGQNMVQGHEGVYRAATVAPTSPLGGGHIAPAAGLSQNVDVARQQASAAGSRASALGSAASTLEKQHAVMNSSINRAGLVGAAAGTGLMGYMAVPHQYGGVGPMPGKTAGEARVEKIQNRMEDVGLGVLAAPAASHLAEIGTRKLMLRGGRLGGLAAMAHGPAEAASHFFDRHVPEHATELGGLAVLAPSLMHPLAHGVDKVLGGPKIAPNPETQQVPALKLAAEQAGRLLAREKTAINVADVASGIGRAAWNNRRTIAGVGAVGAVAGGLYGAKKTVDAATNFATRERAPARYPGVAPGMRPAAPVSMY